MERARAAGAVLKRPIVSRKWGRMANMADPFGHGCCLLQFTGHERNLMSQGAFSRLHWSRKVNRAGLAQRPSSPCHLRAPDAGASPTQSP